MLKRVRLNRDSLMIYVRYHWLFSQPFSFFMSLPLIVTGALSLFDTAFAPRSFLGLLPGPWAVAFTLMALTAGLMIVIGLYLSNKSSVYGIGVELTGHFVAGGLWSAYFVALVAGTPVIGGTLFYIGVICLGLSHLGRAVYLSALASKARHTLTRAVDRHEKRNGQ